MNPKIILINAAWRNELNDPIREKEKSHNKKKVKIRTRKKKVKDRKKSTAITTIEQQKQNRPSWLQFGFPLFYNFNYLSDAAGRNGF